MDFARAAAFFLWLPIALVSSHSYADMTYGEVWDLLYLSPEEFGARLQSDIDPNSTVEGRETLLMAVIRDSNDATHVKVLLDSGAEVDATNMNGMTALLDTLMFGARDDQVTDAILKLLIERGAKIDFVTALDMDRDGSPEIPAQLMLAQVISASKTLGARERIIRALELGARFSPPTQADFATPFFWGATFRRDPEMAAAFLEAGAQPCFFPTEHADDPVKMFDGKIRPRSAVWDIQWQSALETGLKEVLAAYPDILSDLLASEGRCPTKDE